MLQSSRGSLRHMRERIYDVAIIGGGTGGCAAALTATRLGLSVVMTEETDWIGGQLTSQIVPPDEHPWIESFGCTRTYRRYRELVRAYYRDHTPLTAASRQDPHLNPGGGWVSRLCHDPRIGWQVLNSMLYPALMGGRLDLRLRTRAISADVEGDEVRSIRIINTLTGAEDVLHAKIFLDATELGDLLPLTGTEYVIGAESRQETGEPSAIDGPAEPENVQGLTWCLALAHDEGSHRVIDKPAQYERWKAYKPDFWPGPQLGFEVLHAHTGEPRELPLYGRNPGDWYALFPYRQIVDPQKFEPSSLHPVTVVNWPQNDYFVATILDVSKELVAERLDEARQLSLSLVYWLQTEAPRHDGGTGYPGLYLRPEFTGTDDGFAQAPYIRESRRIRARGTILEQHLSAEANPGKNLAPLIEDTVGIGAYRIDLHPSTNGKNTIDRSTLPFQLPLSSLVPIRVKNLLPACKNIGATHITNGSTRLHPIEWNIGESAAALASFCLKRQLLVGQVVENNLLLTEFQSLLGDLGIELRWPVPSSL